MGIDGEGGMEIDLTDRGSQRGLGPAQYLEQQKSKFSTKAKSTFAPIFLKIGRISSVPREILLPKKLD